PAQPLVEAPQRRRVLVGVERQHRRRVLDGREARERLPGDPLGGGVGGAQLGRALLERHQLAEQAVVLLVGDLGSVADVVEIVVVADLAAQLVDSAGAGGGGAGGAGIAGGPDTAGIGGRLPPVRLRRPLRRRWLASAHGPKLYHP